MAIVVIVAHGYAHRVAFTLQPSLRRHIGERAIAIVPVEPVPVLWPGLHKIRQSRSVGEEKVRPSIAVEIDHPKPAGKSLHLVLAPHRSIPQHKVQSRRMRALHKPNRPRRRNRRLCDLRHHAPPSAGEHSHAQRTCTAQHTPPPNHDIAPPGTFRFGPRHPTDCPGPSSSRAQTRTPPCGIVTSSNHRTSARARPATAAFASSADKQASARPMRSSAVPIIYHEETVHRPEKEIGVIDQGNARRVARSGSAFCSASQRLAP